MPNLLQVDEGGNSQGSPEVICCSVSTFAYSNLCLGCLHMIAILVCLLALILQQGVLIVIPSQAYGTAFVFSTFSSLVICCGLFGQKRKIEFCFLVYVLFMGILLIAQVIGYALLMLYASDVQAIRELNPPIIDGQDVLVDYLETLPADAESWKSTQDALECCGIDYEQRLSDNFEVDKEDIESGDRCNEVPAIAAIGRLDVLLLNNEQDAFDEFDNFIAATIDPVVGFEASFFCKVKISEKMGTGIIGLGLAGGLILVVTFTALISASRLYWVPEYLGGWMFDEEDLEKVADRKGIPFPKEHQAPAAGGKRVLSTIRARTNRLSFRVKNAYTADPSIPKTTGFLNRLSLNRNALSGHGSFRGVGEGGAGVATAGQPAELRPNMFRRISRNLFGQPQAPLPLPTPPSGDLETEALVTPRRSDFSRTTGMSPAPPGYPIAPGGPALAPRIASSPHVGRSRDGSFESK